MESEAEAARLLKKSDYDSSKEQLLLTGLREGLVAIDAGGGAGFVTKIMAEILGPTGNAILIDQSQGRLEAAKSFCSNNKNVSFLQSPLEKISLESGTADYVFCRFVFEYLQSPEVVFAELLRVLKPGGKLVVGDLDNNMLSHYPLPQNLETQLLEIVSQLQAAKQWDPYAGRKIYSVFHKHGLANVKVHLSAHHLIYGTADTRDIENWTVKLDQMDKLSSSGILKLSFDFKKFRQNFMKFFQDPSRFSYSPLILVEGVKR